MIPYARQSISEDDITAVLGVLKSDFLTQGKMVPEFEAKISEYCSSKYAVAVSSATAALHIALLALGVKKGDLVWTSPNSFVASANSALYCSAKIDFVDIDALTYNISINSLIEKLEQAKKSNSLPKVLVVVHFGGSPSQMSSIFNLSKQYGFRIIEDASHALGAEYFGSKIGACKYSDITIFSFHPVKIITTGEGGMALTNDVGIADHMRLLRSHGVTKNSPDFLSIEDGPCYYEQQVLGYNYRLTDIQAALGITQSKKIDEFVEKRNNLANRYKSRLSSCPILFQKTEIEAYSSFHLFVVRMEIDQIGKSQIEIFNEFHRNNILVNLHYRPIYLQPFYRALGFEGGYCKEAELYYQSAISLPIYPELSFNQQDQVIDLCLEIFRK